METNNIYSIEEYANSINIPPSELIGRSRKQIYSIPRQVYLFYLYNQKIPIQKIGKKFGRHHSTVIHSVKNISNLIDVKDKIVTKYLSSLEIFSLM